MNTDLIEKVSGDISVNSVRDKIEALEAEWAKLPQVEIPVVHRFSGGIYAREITIPEDTFLTGRIYKENHFDVMVYGDVTVSSDEGKKRLTGFNIFEGNTGKKRAGYAHKETKWITFCTSEEMEDDEYLEALTCGSFDELTEELKAVDYIEEHEIVLAYKSHDSNVDYHGFRQGYLAAKGKRSKWDADTKDYNAVLLEYGFTEKQAREQSENIGDQTPLSNEYSVQVGDSIIQGKGLYTTKTFKAGAVIMPARVGGKRTLAGRYVNHSVLPNSIMKVNGSNIDLVALRDLSTEELTCDYRDSLDIQISKAV